MSTAPFDADVPSLAEVIEAGFMHTGERWPRIREGERPLIPGHVRLAVYFRDRSRCAFCPADREITGPWHLDHIIPWSAGGSDLSSNLRVLCEDHNLTRSNYRDNTEYAKRAVTWWCHRCYDGQHRWDYFNGYVLTCPVHTHRPRFGDDDPDYASDDDLAYLRHVGDPLKYCRVARAVGRLRDAGEPDPTGWHQSPPMDTFEHVAYCAHCARPGMTGRAL